MRRFSIASLGVLASISPVITTLNAPPQAPPPQHGTVLKPINIVDYEASMGLQRREPHDLSVMNPRTTQILYNDKRLLANMTLYAPDGLPIVLLERFEERNISVKCKDEEGTLLLTFGSTDAFDYAKKQWGYINEADDGKFLFIVNKDGCGFDEQRQPYIISNITDATATLTTSLAAQAVPLSEVAGSYELDFCHAIPINKARQLQDRGLWHDAIKGDANNSSSANFPISKGQPNQRMNIFTDPQAGLTIDCTNCFIAGSLEVIGHVLIQDFSPQELSLTVSPNSVFAALELEAIISASDDLKTQPYTKILYNGAIPDAGISIGGIFDLGATLVYTVGGNCEFSGSANVDFGVNASLPDSAQIVADYVNNGASSVSGFGSFQLAPMFQVNNESAAVTLSAFSQPEIKFGIDLKKVGNVDVTVTIQLPELTTTLTAEHDKDGACSNDIGASKTGVTVGTEASIEVDLEIDAKVGMNKDDDEKPLFSTQLYTTSMPLPSTCLPMNIPGLASSLNATTGTSLPATLSMSTVVSGGLAIPTPSLGLGRRWAINSTSVFPIPTSYPSRLKSRISSSFPSRKPSSGTVSGFGITLGVTASPSPSSANPSPTSPSRGSEFVSSVLAAILGHRKSSVGGSSSVPSTTSASLEAKSTSMPATLSPSSEARAASTLSSPISRDFGIRSSSTFYVSTTTSTTESSSMSPSNSASSSLRQTSQSTPASSKDMASSSLSSPTSNRFSTTSKPTTSSTDSRSESGSGSSSMPLSSTSSSPKTTSILTPATPSKSSTTKASSIKFSTTSPSSAHMPSQSTEVNSAPVKSSGSESSSTQSSTTFPPSATNKPSQSPTNDAATKSPSQTPSISMSKAPSDVSPLTSTTTASSPPPDTRSQTSTSSPTQPSHPANTQKLQPSLSPTTTSTSTTSSPLPVTNTHTAANDPKLSMTPKHTQPPAQSTHIEHHSPSQTGKKNCHGLHGCS